MNDYFMNLVSEYSSVRHYSDRVAVFQAFVAEKAYREEAAVDISGELDLGVEQVPVGVR